MKNVISRIIQWVDYYCRKPLQGNLYQDTDHPVRIFILKNDHLTVYYPLHGNLSIKAKTQNMTRGLAKILLCCPHPSSFITADALSRSYMLPVTVYWIGNNSLLFLFQSNCYIASNDDVCVRWRGRGINRIEFIDPWREIKLHCSSTQQTMYSDGSLYETFPESQFCNVAGSVDLCLIPSIPPALWRWFLTSIVCALLHHSPRESNLSPITKPALFTRLSSCRSSYCFMLPS